MKDEEALKDINRYIVRLGKKLGKPVVATGDVHFKEPKDAIYRAILMDTKGFEDCDHQPPLYFRTTDEMLKEFAYLGEEEAYNVVVKAPNEIAARVEHIPDLFMKAPDGGDTFQPFWEDAEQNLRELCDNRAHEIFGDEIPEIVRARLDKELGSISEQLVREQILVKKYKMYSQQCSDPQLRTKCEQAAAKHQNHYNTLLNQLN